MPSQQQVTEFKHAPEVRDSDPEWDDNIVGEFGEPTYWLGPKWDNLFGWMTKVGDIIYARHKISGIEYRYVVKEYKDGWWKLEWPD